MKPNFTLATRSQLKAILLHDDDCPPRHKALAKIALNQLDKKRVKNANIKYTEKR